MAALSDYTGGSAKPLLPLALLTSVPASLIVETRQSAAT